MRRSTIHAAVAGLFAVSLLVAPIAVAEEGKTSSGGTSANSGSDGAKADKGMQDNAASADKNKQQK